MKSQIFICITIFFLGLNTVSGQTFRSVNNPPNNAWNDPSTWDLASIPGAGDTVLIRNNDTVNITSNTNIDKLTLRGNGELNITSGNTLTILQNLSVQAQNYNGNTSSLIVNGTLNVGGSFAITSRKRINYNAVLSGSGLVSVTSNFNTTGDTSGTAVTISVPISVGNNSTFTVKNSGASLYSALNSTLTITKNFTLRTQNGADSTYNQFDMRFSGASLSIGNNFNLTTGGGFLLNSTAFSSSVIFSTFTKIKISDQIPYSNVHVTTSSNVNADKDFTNILGSFIIDNGCNISTNRRTWKMSSGNLIVNGTITSYGGDDSLIMQGLSSQTISGSGNADIETLVINNSNGVANSLDIDIIRVLKIQNGTFTTGGNVTLKSTSDRTAYLTEIGNNGVGASVSGAITCERNISGASTTGYRHISSPVQSSQISDFQEGSSAAGFFTYGFTGSNSPSIMGYNSCYQYDPSLANGSGILDDGWVAATNSNNSITPYKAWSFYSGGTSGSGAKVNYDLSTTGNVYSGQVIMNTLNSNLALTTGGVQEWGFIGNPYPSAIQWDNVTKINVSSVAQVYGVDDYNGYRTTNFNAASNRIPPFQAFWVQTTSASPIVTFEENDKITNNIDFRKSAQFENRLYLEVKDSVNNYNVQACLELNSQASPNYDAQLDGLVFKNPWPYPNMYFPIQDSLNGQVYSTSTKAEQVIPLSIYAAKGKSGKVELSFYKLPKLASCLRLEDRKLNKFISIDTNTIYSFILSEDENENRFFIHYSPGITNVNTQDLTCNNSNDGIIIFSSTSKLFSPTIFNLNNDTVELAKSDDNWKASDLRPGNYILQLNGINGCQNLEFHMTILEPAPVISSFETNYNTYNINEEIDFENKSSGALNYYWEFSNNQTSFLYQPKMSYKKPGVKLIRLVASNGNIICNDTSTFEINIIPVPTFNEELNQNLAIKLASTENGYFLFSNNSQAELLTISVYDLSGSLISTKKALLDKSRVPLSIPSVGGIYIIHVSTNESEQYFKIVGK